MSDTKVAMLQRSTTDITPQGYTYAIEPNTTHPFWKEDGGESNYKYTELQTPVEFENTNTNYTTFDLVQDEPAFFAPLTLSLVEVVINTEVALPFVGILHGDVAFLICEGVERNKLRAVGVYASSDMSTLRVEGIKSTPAPIKGENGKDGVTPDVTATASVNNTTGIPSVNVTRSGSTASPVFDFSFMNIKGEKGEQGERGADGTNGTNGTDGVTPNISVIATVDDTTGIPNVEVTKSGTPEAPIFDFEFTGLKGEGGGSSEWSVKTTTTDNLGSEIEELISKASELYIMKPVIKSHLSGLYVNVNYVDGDAVKKISQSYKSLQASTNTTPIHLVKVGNDWVSDSSVYMGGGNINLYNDNGNDDILIYNPSFAVNNLNISGNDSNIILGLVNGGQYYLHNTAYTGNAVLSVQYSGLFIVNGLISGSKIYYK